MPLPAPPTPTSAFSTPIRKNPSSAQRGARMVSRLPHLSENLALTRFSSGTLPLAPATCIQSAALPGGQSIAEAAILRMFSTGPGRSQRSFSFQRKAKICSPGSSSGSSRPAETSRGGAGSGSYAACQAPRVAVRASVRAALPSQGSNPGLRGPRRRPTPRIAVHLPVLILAGGSRRRPPVSQASMLPPRARLRLMGAQAP